MKLATLKSDKRDGRLVVVDRALTRAVAVTEIAPTLQAALDDWGTTAPRLQAVYDRLNAHDIAGTQSFAAQDCAAPLPRAYHWVDGSAYVNHVELVRKARGAEMPASFWHDPLVYQGGSDDFLGATDDIVVASEDYGIDMEAEVAVITTDVPMATVAADAAPHIVLLMLVNDVSLRNLVADELAKGFGFYQSKPSSAFSPVAVTPGELGAAWHDGSVHLPLTTSRNGSLFGQPHCGVDMTFTFLQLIAHASKTRRLRAGTIVGSGTVSNYDRTRGSSCIAERRMSEMIATGIATTPYLGYGERVRIEMFDRDGRSILGAIDQRVARPPGRN